MHPDLSIGLRYPQDRTDFFEALFLEIPKLYQGNFFVGQLLHHPFELLFLQIFIRLNLFTQRVN